MPSDRADLAYYCRNQENTPIQTCLSVTILGEDAEGQSLSAEEFDKVDRAQIALVARLAERYPSFVFFDTSGTVFRNARIIELANEGGSRAASWEFMVTVGHILEERRLSEQMNGALASLAQSQSGSSKPGRR